jgi:ubiquitin carboxyl-terminal hydrolase 9/24
VAQTNREEKHMNIDCQIRGKSDVQEALAAMCETETMEGINQVFCDRCKKNTDTVLRNTISELPNMMILSLKRFDLDYTTFETVKLNSRCAFGQTLNMKRYTLEGVEALELAEQQKNGNNIMDTGTEESAMRHLQDEDYEFELAGVLVHAGVAQGGHYYSFIRDRSDGKWYRFDDEDVTPFDPASIEVECFGGKVKKETKWPNGQVHTVESEQYANALMLFYEKVKPKKKTMSPQEDEKENIPDLTSIRMTSGYDVFEPDVRRSNDTHRWQSFLFDAEFQNFLQGLLGLCRLSSNEGNQGIETDTSLTQGTTRGIIPSPWRKTVVEMLLSFLFDVLLYSHEKPALNDWILYMEQIMADDIECAQAFTSKLGQKATEVSGNWLRTYLLECPDQTARIAGVRVFSKAIEVALSVPSEGKNLERWTEAWKEQIALVEGSGRMPSSLETKRRIVEKLAADELCTTAIGTVVSSLNELVDAIPRAWRFSPELFLFIRNLCSIPPSCSGDLLQCAVVNCLLPARLICIVTRQRVHPILRMYFPAASVRTEVAETQLRPEQNPHSHQMMPMGGNHILPPPDLHYRGGTSPFDYIYLFESLGCLMGIPGIIQAPLLAEQDDQGRGRQRIELSDPAMHALREVFHENCAEYAPGMSQREIEAYLYRSGVDNVSSQKIIEMMAKYPSTQSGNGSKGSNYLSLEGFLAYYRDFSQTNEVKVRTLTLMFPPHASALTPVRLLLGPS